MCQTGRPRDPESTRQNEVLRGSLRKPCNNGFCFLPPGTDLGARLLAKQSVELVKTLHGSNKNNNNNFNGFLYSAHIRHSVTLKALQH